MPSYIQVISQALVEKIFPAFQNLSVSMKCAFGSYDQTKLNDKVSWFAY